MDFPADSRWATYFRTHRIPAKSENFGEPCVVFLGRLWVLLPGR